jgi:WD40 repeat protein
MILAPASASSNEGLLQSHADRTLAHSRYPMTAYKRVSAVKAPGALARQVMAALLLSLMLPLPFLAAAAGQTRPVQTCPMISIQRGHNGLVHGVAFSRDGKLASGSEDGNICIWGVPDGRLLKKIQIGGGDVRPAAFSLDGQIVVATEGQDHFLGLWRISDGKLIKLFDGRSYVEPDSDGHTAYNWDLLAFSPDGTIVVTRQWVNGPIYFVRVEDGHVLKTLKAHGNGSEVDSLAFSDDQKLLATLSIRARTAKIWNFPECTLIGLQTYSDTLINHKIVWREGRFVLIDMQDHKSEILGPGGQLPAFLGSGQDVVKLWRVSDGQLLKSGRAQWAFGPDGKRLVSWEVNYLSGHKPISTITIWDADTVIPIRGIVLAGHSINSIAIGPDSRALAVWSTTTDNQNRKCQGLQIIQALDGKIAVNLKWSNTKTGWPQETVDSVHFSSDGRALLLASRNRIEILRLGSALESVKTWTGYKLLATSPDGRYIAVRNEDVHCHHSIELVRIEGGTVVRDLEVPFDSQGVTQAEDCPIVSFSPDGRFFAVCSTRHGSLRSLKLWSISKGGLIAESRRIPGTGDKFTMRGSLPEVLKRSVSFKINNEVWRLSGDALVRIRGIASSPVIEQGSNRASSSTNPLQPALSDDGRLLACREPRDDGINIVNASSGKQIRILKSGQNVNSMRFSFDGKLLVSEGPDSLVLVKRASDGNTICKLSGGAGLISRGDKRDEVVAFSPDGHLLAAGGWKDNSLRIWRKADGSLAKIFEGHHHWATDLQFSPDGKFLAAGHADGTVQLWNMASGKLARAFPSHPDSVGLVQFSPAGDCLATASYDGAVRLWSLPDGKFIKDFRGAPLSAIKITNNIQPFIPNGSLIAIQGLDNEINLWRISDGACIRSLVGHKGLINCLSFSPDGKRLISSSSGNNFEIEGTYEANLWRVSDGALLNSFSGEGLMVPGFSRDGTLVAVEDSEKSGLRFRWLLDGRIVRAGPSAADPWLTVSYRGGVFALNSGRFWSVQKKRFFRISPEDNIRHMDDRTAFSRDLRLFAVSHPNGDVQIYHISEGKLIQTIRAHSIERGDGLEATPLGIAFSPDGQFLASANQDGTIRLMGRRLINKKEQFELVLTLAGSSTGEGIAFTPEGYYDTGPEGSSLVTWVFSGSPGLEAFSFEQFETSFHKPEIISSRLKGDFDAGKTAPPVTRPPYIEMPDHLTVRQTSAASYPLKLSVSALDEVKTLRIFVNGKPTSELPVNAQGKGISVDAPLLPGMNRITAMAYNKEGFSSNPRYVDVLCTRTDLPKPNLYVLSIGVSAYPNLPSILQLDFAHTDAKALASALKKQEGGVFGRVYECLITNQDVTLEKVTDALDALSAIRESDVAIVYMAGHGVQSTKDGAFYFLTHTGSLEEPERGGIGWKHLRERLTKIKGRVIVLLDACHSGSITTQTVVPNDELARELTREGRSGVMVLAASKGRQASQEGPDIGGGSGAFAYAVCQALGPRSKEADSNDNGFVEFSELVELVARLVHRETEGEQTPWLARRELLGDFPVSKVMSPE